MRILRPVIGAQALLMPTRETNGPQGRPVRPEFVGDDRRRGEALLLEQFSQQFQRGGLVAASLDQDIENFALAVDCPPQTHVLTANRDDHFVQMPMIVRPWSNAAEISGDRRPEFQNPSTDGFIADFRGVVIC